MFKIFKDAWKIEELRKKLTFTLMIIVIYRIGCSIPVPFIDPAALSSMASAGDGNVMFGYLNSISGGAFLSATLFALGVIPYINASIIMTLLTVAIPYLENLARMGDEGRRQISKITRYVGAVLGFILAILYYFVLRNSNALAYSEGLEGWFTAFVIILAFLAGTMLVMWMGEQIDANGLGSGISIIIFTGIISGLPSTAYLFYDLLVKAVTDQQTQNFFLVPALLVLAVLAVAFAVVLSSGERRISIQYAKRVVGRKMMGGQSTYLPIKVNMSGVMPIIFAGAIISFPGTIISFFDIQTEWIVSLLRIFNYDSIFYAVAYAALIFLFNTFYVETQYNPTQIANDLRKNNGSIPGFRPGKNTEDFIKNVIKRITFVGSMFLVVVAISPILIGNITNLNIQLGGTSLLIVVGVALDVSRQLESQLVSRHHKGFLE